MKRLTALFFVLFIALNVQSQESINMYIFGHSLIDHRPPMIPTPSDETTVPHWVYLLAEESGYAYTAGGQYGFLPQHANVPPVSQWGYDIVPPVWDSEMESFVDADITTILLTAGNFMQWQGPDEEYPTNPGVTPVSATETVFDWVEEQGNPVRYYIYENWPDMAEFLQNGFPPTVSEFEDYNQYIAGTFHDWWIVYHDALLASRPDMEVKMIPVGPSIRNLYTNLLNGMVPVTELYEDDAPHGRASTYFLAGLVTYMAVYQEKAPASYNVPEIVHEGIREKYPMIVDFIWNELEAFNDDDGNSRVFFDTGITDESNLVKSSKRIQVYPNPTTNQLIIKDFDEAYLRIFSSEGKEVWSQFIRSDQSIDIGHLSNGIYYLQLNAGKELFIDKIVVK